MATITDITLTLTNFRCWQNKIVTIPTSGIVLLSGRSGRGKSTILNAIVYAVTGSGKNITTFGKKSTSVELKMESFTIKRTRGPNRLLLHKGDMSYEDDEAQSMINAIFGTEFCNTSYIDQDNANSFVFKNPSSKMEFLETLLLHSYDIDGMKDKVKNDMGLTKTNYATEDGRVDALSTMLSKLTITPSTPLTIDGITITSANVEKVSEKIKGNLLISEKNIKTLSQKIKKGESDFQLYLTQSEKHKGLQRIVSDINDELDKLKDLSTMKEKLSSLEKTKKHYNTLKKYLEWKEIRDEVNEMRSKNEKEKDRLNGMILTLEPLQVLKKNLSQLEKANRLIDLIVKLEDEIQDPPDFTKHIDDYKTLLINMKDRLSRLQKELSNRQVCYSCPSCHKVLKFSSDKLVMENDISSLKDTCEISGDIKSLKKQIEENEKEYDEWKIKESVFKKNEKDYNEWFDKLDGLLLLENGTLVAQEEIDNVIETIKASIDIHVTVSTSLKEIENDRLFIQRVKDEEKLRLSDSDVLEDDDQTLQTINLQSLLEEISSLRVTLDNEKTLREKYNTLLREMESITLTKNNEEQIKMDREKYELYETKAAHYREMIVKLNDWSRLEKERISYEKLRSDIKQSTEKKEYYLERLRGLTKLRDHIKNAEKSSLDEFIHSLNAHASVYIDEFFVDDDILVELKTTQEGKTSGKEKVALNFEVTYRGMSGDLYFLSGGEKDRVNLAFTLAFSELVDTRVLLLDECISSLDAETTNVVLEHLKEKYKGKLMIVVSHQANLGFFDSVIEI
jgi:DNA repair exonuclease SbcCD ATPase subunit